MPKVKNSYRDKTKEREKEKENLPNSNIFLALDLSRVSGMEDEKESSLLPLLSSLFPPPSSLLLPFLVEKDSFSLVEMSKKNKMKNVVEEVKANKDHFSKVLR